MEEWDNNNLSIGQRIKRASGNCFPIRRWFPLYRRQDIFPDLVAGISVALAAIPQCMAYAVLAGISPQYGLYSSFLGPFVYIFLGSCRQVTVGPTAVSSLLVYETCGNNFPDCVILVAFYAGIIQLLLAILRIGNFVALISDPVTLGFTSGAALTIASSQLKSLLGFSSTKAATFLGYWEAIFENWGSICFPDVIMGFSCLLMLLILQNLKVLICDNCDTSRSDQSYLRNFFWAVGVSRTILVVISASLVAFFWTTPPPFKIVGFVKPGLPSLQVPKFRLLNKWDNETSEADTLTYVETVRRLGFGPSLVALVTILQNVAISKAYGIGQRIDGNQELLSLGVGSVLGGFISAQPVSASFSRSALNDASGVRSQFGGFFTGTAILISLSFLTPAFYYIPRPALAAVIIAVVINMVDCKAISQIWQVSKIDMITYLVTFISSILLNMEFGIGIGVGFSILLFLYKFISTKLRTDVETDEEDPLLAYVIIRSPNGLHFPDVDALRKHVNQCSNAYQSTNLVIVLDCINWLTVDFTGATAIFSLIRAAERNRKFIVLLCPSDVVVNALKRIGLTDEEMLRICCKEESDLKNVIRKLLESNLST